MVLPIIALVYIIFLEEITLKACKDSIGLDLDIRLHSIEILIKDSYGDRRQGRRQCERRQQDLADASALRLLGTAFGNG